MMNSVQLSHWLTHTIFVGSSNMSAIISNRAPKRNVAQTHEPYTKMEEATGPKLSASGKRPKPLQHTSTPKGGNDTGELGPTRPNTQSTHTQSKPYMTHTQICITPGNKYIRRSARMPGLKKPIIPSTRPKQASKTKNHKPGLKHPGFK